jgi:hypothetical protein
LPPQVAHLAQDLVELAFELVEPGVDVAGAAAATHARTGAAHRAAAFRRSAKFKAAAAKAPTKSAVTAAFWPALFWTAVLAIARLGTTVARAALVAIAALAGFWSAIAWAAIFRPAIAFTGALAPRPWIIVARLQGDKRVAWFRFVGTGREATTVNCGKRTCGRDRADEPPRYQSASHNKSPS